jgi:dipeptidyl aminopeptidase/acylaminoacyl peptidase
MTKCTIPLLILLFGCKGQLSAPPKPVATPTPAPNTVGGILYDKATALEATEKALSENKPDAMRTVAVTYKSAKEATVPGLLVLPPNISAGKPVPTVLLLHGLG